MEDKETILKLYDTFVKELPPPETYKKIRSKFEEEKKKFLENIENQNEHTLEDLLDLIELADNELMKQAYMEAFSTATKLIIESLSNKQ